MKIIISPFNYQIMKQLVKKTKGTATIYDDESIEFSPQGKGEPVYENLLKSENSSIKLTTGRQQKNYVAKLKCAADCADPIEDMHEQLDKLSAKLSRICPPQ